MGRKVRIGKDETVRVTLRPSLDLVVGTHCTWHSAFAYTKDGKAIALVGNLFEGFAGLARKGEQERKLEIEEMVVTDMVPLPPRKRLPNITVLSVAPLLAEVIRRIHLGISVGALFNE